MKHRTEVVGILLAVRVALAATIAFALADLLQLHHPIYAFDRFIETLFGVMVAWGVSAVPHLIRIELEDREP